MCPLDQRLNMQTIRWEHPENKIIFSLKLCFYYFIDMMILLNTDEYHGKTA